MNIKINQQLKGIDEIRGTAVIIDVFRAFSVESYLFGNNISTLYAVGDKDLAYNYRRSHPGALLIGEREGAMLPGFDFGNSPSQVEDKDFSGKTAIHTTSAGTQGISGAVNAAEILGASLVNAAATAKYILNSGTDDVTIVCMGLGAKVPTEEDTLCGEYIRAMLLGRAETDSFCRLLPERIERLKKTDGAKFFDPRNAAVFPRRDFYLSTEIDRFGFAITAKPCGDGFYLMNRVDM